MDDEAHAARPELRMERKLTPASLIGIVGPCGAGKTTLARALQDRGFQARQIAQEHSYVPRMWFVLTHPDVLVYLDASYHVCSARKAFDWTPEEYAEQLGRLSHARLHCDIFLNTDDVSPAEVLSHVLGEIGGGSASRPNQGQPSSLPPEPEDPHI
jgi:ATPase subunit of ABC transporter with duplicated ATPase domains